MCGGFVVWCMDVVDIVIVFVVDWCSGYCIGYGVVVVGW